MRDVIALVLAGGRVGDFGVLTQNRPKGALHFAGTYRVIDFALSALHQAGIDQIGIIIQYLPASLIEHVGVGQPWDLQGYGRTLKVMPPFVGIDTINWYKGTADAILKNLNFLDDSRPTHVIVVSGEHVYNLDYRPVIEMHRSTRADVTMVTKFIPDDLLTRRFGYVVPGEGGRIMNYFEKPATPPTNIVSTGIYVFRTEVLTRLLHENAIAENHNLAKDVLQPNVPHLNCREYRMEGYWEYLEGSAEYHAAHMDLLNSDLLQQMRRWGTLTNLEYRGVGFAPPAVFGKSASVTNSLIAPGCRIDGIVEESVLSPGVVVSRDAVVRRSVLMHDCHVHENAVVEHVVSDKDVHFLPHSAVGMASDLPTVNRRTRPTLIGKAARIGAGVRIPLGSEIRPGKSLHDQTAADAEV